MDIFSDETVCLRCGRCCHEKFRLPDGTVVITDIPCRFLDTGTRLCRVYPRRARRQPRCSTARDSAAIGGLPGDCPYVAGCPGYPPPRMLSDHPEHRDMADILFPSPRKSAQ